MTFWKHPFSFYREPPTAIRFYRCPSCNETLAAAARTCRFCNRPIDDATAERLILENQRVTTAVARANTFRLTVLVAVFMTVAGITNWLLQGSMISVLLPLIGIGYGIYWLYQYRSLVTKDADFPPAVRKVKLTMIVWAVAFVIAGAITMSDVVKARRWTQRSAVELQGANPPAFVLSGPGKIINFSVGIFSPELPEDSPDRVQIIWEITADDLFSDSTELKSVERITYGTVPDGFSQIEPALPLSPLEPGKYYVFYLLRLNEPHVMGAFELKEGKLSRVYGLSFCTRLNEKGDRVWTRCSGDTNPAE